MPLVFHISVPSMTHSPPSRSARVTMPATFDPWAGSEMAVAMGVSPAAIGGSHSSRIHSSSYASSISVPKSAAAMEPPTPASARQSSSVTTGAPSTFVPVPLWASGIRGATKPYSPARAGSSAR